MQTTNGWTFGIVTAPGNDHILSRCLKTIADDCAQHSDVEVIVIGKSAPEIPDGLSVRIVEFQERVPNRSLKHFLKCLRRVRLRDAFTRTGWITRKKNLIAELASQHNLCIMHDYVGFMPGWFAGFDRHGDDWSVAVTKITNADGERHRDWMVWDYPEVGPSLLPYDRVCSYMYISGAYFCVKRDFFLQNKLDERLFWGEAEDVEWSLRVREKTAFSINVHSEVRYLKMKPKDDAPNCSSWIENRKKLMTLIANNELKS